MKLVIGNRNYSSWSLRAWMAMEAFGIPREEEVVPLDQPESAARIAAFSAAGRVPVLLDGDLAVWDSLAICEYLAERFPERGLWPTDPAARAVARSACAEMHSGFQALREACPMKCKEVFDPKPLAPEVQANVARIVALWEECRRRFGQGGPFLFGAFSLADAFYAPVVSRFRTYGVKLPGPAEAYAQAMWAHPAMQKWLAAARAETFAMKRYG